MQMLGLLAFVSSLFYFNKLNTFTKFVLFLFTEWHRFWSD